MGLLAKSNMPCTLVLCSIVVFLGTLIYTQHLNTNKTVDSKYSSLYCSKLEVILDTVYSQAVLRDNCANVSMLTCSQ